MSAYLTEKYAGILTEEDVSNLFDLLVKKLGNNRSEAARRCGLTGKATYDWEETAYVKLGTKKKVLNASLREIFLETIEYLLARSSNRSLDLIRTILSTLYANAIDTALKEDYEDTLNKFEMVRNKYLGMINDGIRDEVTDMTVLLRKKAIELGVLARTKTIRDFSSEELIDTIQVVGQLYVENPLEAEFFAERNLNLPTSVLKPLIQTFRNLHFARQKQTSAITEPYRGEGQTLSVAAKPSLTFGRGQLFAILPFEENQKAKTTQTGEPIYEIATTS